MKSLEKHGNHIGAVVVFGIFFGLLEAVVVIYLRQLLGIEDSLVDPPIGSADIALNFVFIGFLKPSASLAMTLNAQLLSLELWRELATLAMLACMAFIAGQRNREKVAYFFLAFGVWDIFYYVFLKVFVGWPATLADMDIYFLIPVAWVGPVITPLVISLIMVALSIFIITKTKEVKK